MRAALHKPCLRPELVHGGEPLLPQLPAVTLSASSVTYTASLHPCGDKRGPRRPHEDGAGRVRPRRAPGAPRAGAPARAERGRGGLGGRNGVALDTRPRARPAAAARRAGAAGGRVRQGAAPSPIQGCTSRTGWPAPPG